MTETPLINLPNPKAPMVQVAGPLIRVPKFKWARDPGVSELIEYFDRPELLNLKNNSERWAKLRVNEIREIEKVLERCRSEFQYAARNFFWLTTKQRGNILFQLWEAQELLLEFMMRLKAKGIAQRVMIIKSRQLGCSTLIEALIAWRTMFFENVVAFVVADNPRRAADLFSIMHYIYSRLPWWLQPMCSSLEKDEGLVFENKNIEDRRTNPGLNSKIIVDSANKLTGVGQGYAINAAHLSEWPSYSPQQARKIIEEDLGNALSEGPETFAFLEGTAKGAGTYAHRLWIKNFNLGDDAKWFPKFLPWFFESTRKRIITFGWKPDPPEAEMRERVERDWTRCDNSDCLQYHERIFRNEDRDGATCPTCEIGKLKSYTLTDEQCAWMGHERKNASGDPDSLKNLAQEMCTTSDESFQVGGHKTFSDAAMAWVSKHLEDPFAVGQIDKLRKFHGCNKSKKLATAVAGEFLNPCFQPDCTLNHAFDPMPLQIYRFPQRGYKYVIAGDPAGGLGGDSNSSVAVVIRQGKLYEPDEQVAVFRSNTVDPLTFAEILVYLGYFYNKALVVAENNRYDVVANAVKNTLLYPNTYQQKTESGNNSVKLGWETNENSKGRLYGTMCRWLDYKQLLIHSRNFAEEMKTFKRVDNEKGNGRSTYRAGRGFSDDELIATMIGLYVLHENDYDENLGYVVMRADLSLDTAMWHMTCGSCGEIWPAVDLQSMNCCPKCRSKHISASKNAAFVKPKEEDPELDMLMPEREPAPEPEYDLL